MSFDLKLRFIELAEKHETIDFTMFNDEEKHYSYTSLTARIGRLVYMTDTIKILAAMVFFWLVCIFCYDFGWYSQLYSTMPSDGYSTIYYEYSTPYGKTVMKLAAMSRCHGQLEEDFSCSVPGDEGYEGS